MIKFIRKLQNSDEQTKKIWLVGLSAVSMAVVIFFWLIYFNRVVNNSAVSDNKPQKADTGFWRIMENGFSVVGGDIKTEFKNLIGKIINEKTYTWTTK